MLEFKEVTSSRLHDRDDFAKIAKCGTEFRVNIHFLKETVVRY